MATGWLVEGGEVDLGAEAGATCPMVGTTGVAVPGGETKADAWHTLAWRAGRCRGGRMSRQGMVQGWWRTSWGGIDGGRYGNRADATGHGGV